MRVNVYAEEMTNKVELVVKQGFVGIRFYTELPVKSGDLEVRGPFMHRPGDNDSSAVTFWSRGNMRELLLKAIALLDQHHADRARITLGMGMNAQGDGGGAMALKKKEV